MDSVLCAVGICKGRRHWECSQGRLCVEERLSHWVLKHKQEVADAKARGQSGGPPVAMWLISRPPGSGGLFLLSLWRWQILQPRAPAIYQGPSQGQGLPLPAAEAVGPWLRKQLRQGTQGREAERTRGRSEGGTENRRRGAGCRAGRARVRDRSRPWLAVLPGRAPALFFPERPAPLWLHSFIRHFLMASFRIHSFPLLT